MTKFNLLSISIGVLVLSVSLPAFAEDCFTWMPGLDSVIAASVSGNSDFQVLKVSEVSFKDLKYVHDGKIPAAYARALTKFQGEELQGRAPRECATELTFEVKDKEQVFLQGRCLAGAIDNGRHELFFTLLECETYTENKSLAHWLNSVHGYPATIAAESR